MGTIQKIQAIIKRSGEGVTAEALESALGHSRQYIVRLLGRLISEGKIHKRGKTRAAKYYLGKQQEEFNSLELVKERKNLSESAVFEEIRKRMQLERKKNRNCLTIFDYAFTEMLNNAIDHSYSKKVWINVEIDNTNINFVIKDLGIGAIESIKRHFKINDDFLALEHLFKGKQTTDKEAHSGQGIFLHPKLLMFTSFLLLEWSSRLITRGRMNC